MSSGIKLAVCTLGTLFIVLSGVQSQSADTPWTWVCQNKTCERLLKAATTIGVPLDICKLNCEDQGSLLPLPSETSVIGKEIVAQLPVKTSFDPAIANYPEPLQTLLRAAAQIFRTYLYTLHPDYQGNGADPFPTSGEPSNNALLIKINITETANTDIRVGTDESYTLVISTAADNRSVTADIRAVTYFGARHALETLSQLFAYDERINALQIVKTANIVDKPIYPYRGVHLDTSRNYFSIPSIKKVIDGMSYNKLNMFHWHITDTHSFPMVVTDIPEMTRYGAYSPKKIYTIEQMKELVQYAKIRGVKIIPEFDEPAHTGNGWQWGPEKGLGNLTVCVNREPWYDFCVEPPCGQLNIVNENMYTVLGNIFKSMLAIFDNDIFHMGGDEVDLRCYNTTDEITSWMTANNYTRDEAGFLRLWGRFQDKAHAKLLDVSTNKSMEAIVWTSELTKESHIMTYLNASEYIVQIWSGAEDEMISGLLNNGYRTIFSNYDALYLDCGFHAWIGDGHNWCSPYKEWQRIYENSPFKIYENLTNTSMATGAWNQGLLLGSETALWTEQADEHSVDSRLWPRGSAHAERLWTNPTTTWDKAELRMITNRQRFVQRGIRPDRLQPEYCSQNQNKCPGPPPTKKTNGSSGLGANGILLMIVVTITTKIFM